MKLKDGEPKKNNFFLSGIGKKTFLILGMGPNFGPKIGRSRALQYYKLVFNGKVVKKKHLGSMAVCNCLEFTFKFRLVFPQRTCNGFVLQMAHSYSKKSIVKKSLQNITK